MVKIKTCQIEGCERDHDARGMCKMHYRRAARRAGGKLPPVTPEERFWRQVQKTETCWLWVGSLMSAGYAHLQIDGAFILAHRWSYQTFVGPIPDGLVIDHLCRVPRCVNPEHLEAVTQRENTRRGLNGFAENECPSGHSYTPENTYRHNGARQCRTCRREAARRYQLKKAAA